MNDKTVTSPEELESILSGAADVSHAFGDLAASERAGMLRVVADALDTAADELVPIAMKETHLTEARLRGELVRTTFQLRLFGDVLDEGGYVEATIDHADPDWGMGPRPDLRRMLIPLGPVVVFSASNFPFAFSVAGGDTASALAAGCPVILKAHSGHPQLSLRTGEIVRSALDAADAPAGTFNVIFGQENGRTALGHPRVKAGSFTGSIPAGRALFDLASSRPEPIPFYGELGSLNPVFVTQGAVKARAEEIVSGFVGSFTLGVGQFCTKPGLLFLPSGHGLDSLLVEHVGQVAEAPMLNDRIASGYRENLTRLVDVSAVDVVAESGATLVRTNVQGLLENADAVLEECFGPASVIVEYESLDELVSAAKAFSGNLTATLHAELDEVDSLGPLLDTVRDRAGRLLWNGWPTGVSVTYAMHHGGPWPATTASIHTSVGTTAIRRFLRPVSYQNAPETLLPLALRDDNPLGIPRLVDGVRQPGS